MAWQPQEESLGQLAALLKDSLSGFDRSRQKRAEEMLAQATTAPDFANYLTFILSSHSLPPSIQISQNDLNTVRFSAAINLKNYIKKNYKTLSKPTLTYIHTSTLVALKDDQAQVRGVAGTVITQLVQQGGLLSWPDLLPDLLDLVANKTGDVTRQTQEGAMSAISKICEDNKKLLDRDINGKRPIDFVIAELLVITGNPIPNVRLLALKTLKVFIPQKPRALLSSLDIYLNQLFQLANDESTEVRMIICSSFVQLVEIQPEVLLPHLEGLVNYILIQQQNADDPALALEAAEFWLSIGDQEQLRGAMGPYLGKVIPVLLQSMIYSEEEAERLGGSKDDADVEDRQEDIRPAFAKSKASRTAAKLSGQGTEVAGGNAGTNGAASMQDDDLSEGEIEESDEDEGFDDPEADWSLRKCSAAALDVFATVYHQPVFEIILPYLKENLAHQSWPSREAAVLALGAIADGCMDTVAPHLPELVPFLISCLNDQESIVRIITCWCLGRYSEWASHLEDPAQKSRYFEPMMDGLLKRMLDNNKKVQEAAASAFASLEEKSGDQLVPYTEPILRQFAQCFGRYKDANMYVLYDCVQTLADVVGAEIAKPNLVDLLMPLLIGRWNKVPDQSQELFPLLECLGYVATAYGPHFAPFSQPIIARCIKIIYDNLEASMAVANGHYVDEPNPDFLVTSLDMISMIIQAVDSAKATELVSGTQPPFFELLAVCIQNKGYEVRQSSYALLGDCAIKVPSSIRPFFPKIMPSLIRELDLNAIKDEDSESGFNVLNNVCWSCGELGAQDDGSLAPYIEPLYQGLVTIMNTEDIPDSVDENASMALGRLGICCSKELGPHLSEFAESFLRSMTKIEHTLEKASAFLGFNLVIEKNPQAMEKTLGDYFTAMAMWPKRELSMEEYADLRTSFERVLRGYRDLIPDFNGFLSQLPPVVLTKLQSTFPLS